MTDTSYEILRDESDQRSLDEIHEEAIAWNALSIPKGVFRRAPKESYLPGDCTIYPENAYSKGLLF